jgi:hypothetical protein
MASKNPFGSLSIRRDDDEEETTTNTAPVTTTQTLFTPYVANPEAKKKKKVRPEEKKKLEEQRDEEGDEGFSVVKKNKAPTGRPRPTTDEAPAEEKPKRIKNKGAYLERNNKVPTGKREFDKHSGTGRGKEIAKGGDGGKHTGGANPKSIAKDAYKKPTGNEDYNEDEDCKN